MAFTSHGHPRPQLVTLTAALDALFAGLALLLAVWSVNATAFPVFAAVAVVAAVLAAGLWRLSPWAGWGQLAVSVPMVCLGFTTVAALVLLVYLSQARTRECFSPGGPTGTCWHSATRSQDSEWPWLVTFAIGSVGGFVGWAVMFGRLAQSGFMR